MKLKLSDKNNRSKLQKKDLIKPAISENLLYRQQEATLQDTINIIEKDNEWLMNAGDNKEIKDGDWENMNKYREMKAQIKHAKKTKEAMISSGFPEFKPYTVLW